MKQTTQQRLNQLMSERNLKQVDILNMSLPLQKETGIKMSKSHLSQYVNGKSSPDQYKLYLLAKTLNVSEAWLLGYDVPKEDKENDVPSIETIYNQLDQKRQAKVYNFADRQLREQKYGVADAGKIVPLKRREPKLVDIYGRLSAGGGAYNDKSVIETVEVDSAPPKYDMAFVVSGDSMEPMFEDGEVVFVNETQDIFNGQIAAIEINNEAFIKKIYLEDKRMRLVSLNTDIKADGSRLYPDFYADECDNLFVIGRVIM
ncbi:helix-turn-helix domain-containing protein [Enterococcus saigonensis]|uniref:Helix-turn-helix domain-containing protein n=1 Tax=Enterococcus saigonensis TaxID=1805431 RepID=A0A679IAM9_9ENTE|nr:S24 family peptidase [Enterococcus saigonensis]BCA86688.1 helix-turn-helix domain-containing protein [Enterococcus saigonensis]